MPWRCLGAYGLDINILAFKQSRQWPVSLLFFTRVCLNVNWNWPLFLEIMNINGEFDHCAYKVDWNHLDSSSLSYHMNCQTRLKWNIHVLVSKFVLDYFTVRWSNSPIMGCIIPLFVLKLNDNAVLYLFVRNVMQSKSKTQNIYSLDKIDFKVMTS